MTQRHKQMNDYTKWENKKWGNSIPMKMKNVLEGLTKTIFKEKEAKKMEPSGLEPPTSCMRSRRSPD